MQRAVLLGFAVAALVGASAHEAVASDPPQPARAAPSSQTQPAASPGISPGHYAAAGVVGTVIGYGVGHAVAGEWSDFGWIFTAGELTPLLVGGATLSFERLNDEDRDNDAMGIALLVGYGVFRVIEIVDIWTRPKVRGDSAAASSQGRWAALPLPSRDGARVLLVGSF